MLKKISIIMALSFALLFGGAFQTSVDASGKDQPQSLSYNILYSLNGYWSTISLDINNLLSKFNMEWKSFNHTNKIEQKEEEPVKEEQPKQKEEEPAKEEQPKQKE